MQCPPTRPGLNGKKFHLLPAASRTSIVSMSNLSKITDSSLIKAIFKSRCVFSITFAASATLIDEAGKVPADIMLLYRSSISLAVSCVEPLVIFLIFSESIYFISWIELSGL